MGSFDDCLAHMELENHKIFNKLNNHIIELDNQVNEFQEMMK